MEPEYLDKIKFWTRLGAFVQSVQVNDPMSDEEKDMILNVCTLMECRSQASDTGGDTDQLLT